MANPPIHALIYGDSGAGKSTGAATFPKPQLVFFFDPLSKDFPYLNRGEVKEIRNADGSLTRHVLSRKDGSLLYQLEYYLESAPKAPQAWGRFVARLTRLEPDIETLGFQTIVLDSITFMEITARKYSQYTLNPTSREPRQWFAFSTDELEEILMIRFGTIPINIVALAHIDDQKVTNNGTNVFSIAAPGRLSRRGPASFGEVYRAYVEIDGSTRKHVWQTRANGLYVASSQINAPDPCESDYRMLWVP